MIDIAKLVKITEAAVAGCEHISSWELVTSEAELKDVIESVTEWPLLVTVLPGAVGDDVNHDNVAESNEALFFVLKPLRERMTREQRIDLWKLTQLGMKEFKEFFHRSITEGDFVDVLWDDTLKVRTQQPEYNIADCSGWSLSFSYSTSGF